MFNAGYVYRVFLHREGKIAVFEGKLIARDPALLALDIEGIKTVFSLSTLLYVEEVDKEAEEARDKARHEAYMTALG